MESNDTDGRSMLKLIFRLSGGNNNNNSNNNKFNATSSNTMECKLMSLPYLQFYNWSRKPRDYVKSRK